MPSDNNQQSTNNNTTSVAPPPLPIDDTLVPPVPDVINPSPATTSASSSSAPFSDVKVTEVAPVVSNVKSRFPSVKGRVIPTILGLLLLIGGASAGVYLVQQNQNIEEQAACYYPETCRRYSCPAGYTQIGAGCNNHPDNVLCRSNTQVCTTPAPTPNYQCDPGADQGCTVNGCPGRQTCNGSGEWGTCYDVPGDNCPATTCSNNGGVCVPSSLECSDGGGTIIAGSCGTNQVCCRNLETTPPSPSPSGSACTGRLQVEYSDINSNSITIDPSWVTACRNVCSDASLYASKCTCTQTGLTGGCNTNCTIESGLGAGDVVSLPAPTCGTIQIDIGCKNSANTYGSIAFVSMTASSACGGGGGGGNPTPTPAPTAQCYDVKAFDTNWVQLTATDLSQLSSGDIVRFTVAGQASTGAFTKARFTINGAQRAEVTDQRPGTQEFYDEYTIPAGTTAVDVTAQIYHETLGWR